MIGYCEFVSDHGEAFVVGPEEGFRCEQHSGKEVHIHQPNTSTHKCVTFDQIKDFLVRRAEECW